MQEQIANLALEIRRYLYLNLSPHVLKETVVLQLYIYKKKRFILDPSFSTKRKLASEAISRLHIPGWTKECMYVWAFPDIPIHIEWVVVKPFVSYTAYLAYIQEHYLSADTQCLSDCS